MEISSTRTILPERIDLFYRRKGEDSEGRGNSWMPGRLSGWDDGAAMLRCGLTGHSRTLSLDLWDLSLTKRKNDRVEAGYAG